MFFEWLTGASRAPTRRPQRAPRLPDRAPRRREARGLRIDYAPSADGDADPGEVVWTWVPYEDDPSRGKDRPVLVIGSDDGRLVGLALTSVDSGRSDHVEIGTGAWDREGRVSYVKLDRLVDLSSSRIRREGAVLDRRRFDAVVRALQRAGRV